MEAPEALLAQLHALETSLAVARLDGVGLLRVIGPDRVEALHRVVSQDIRGLAVGDGKLALLLAPKGQFQALMAVFAAEDATYLLAPAGKGEALATGLANYLRFSRSRIEPVAVAGAAAVLGPSWGELAASLTEEPTLLAQGGWGRGRDGETLWFGQTLLGVPGAVVFSADTADVDAVIKRLAAAGAEAVSDAAVELERVRLGWPVWGAELTETVLPPEVGLEKLAISYTKGCYVGQETIARLATYGHPNRQLVGVRETGEATHPPELPAPLAAQGDERPRETLTSWAHHPRLGGLGIALARRGHATPGTTLTAGPRRFEVATFPLW